MEFLDFLKKTPTAFHAVEELKQELLNNGFIEIFEEEKWNLEKGKKYFLTRNQSSLVAFTIPNDISELSFNITAAHTDSPTFKLKPNFTLDKGKYKMINTEVYGGPILNTWMDRPLNIAGRVVYKDDNAIVSKLISFDKPMAIIPNCSIHYYRELNKGVALNPQIDLVPLVSIKNDEQLGLLDLIAKEIGIDVTKIVSHDLYLALLDRGTIGGMNNEFIMAPQIDNLECSFGCIKAIINSSNDSSSNICVLFDNEEIGSMTRQGAGSKMLADLLDRICFNLGLNQEEEKIALANSFIVSADNAQGYHPNYSQKYDPTNAVYMNEGIVIKNAARGSYTTDAISQAYFKTICELAEAKYQLNTNRSDVLGGSTLGAISLGNVSIHSVDIGLPQIAMHSAYETAGSFDLDELIKALSKFYNMHFKSVKDNKIIF